MKVCRCIRWKSHRHAMTEEERQIAFARSHIPYTCLRTAQPWGADGDVCAPEACGPDRACFEAPQYPTASSALALNRDE